MSHEYYAHWWVTTKDRYKQLVESDQEFINGVVEVKNRPLANHILGGFYIKYSRIVQEIGTCLDQTAQPQKRQTIRKIYDSAVVRLKELNDEIRKVDFSEYHYIDGALVEMKLVPHDVEILDSFYPPVRPHLYNELLETLRKGERIYVRPPTPPPPPPTPPPEETPEATLEGAPPAEAAQSEAVAAAPEQPEPEKKELEKRKRPPKKFNPPIKELTAEEEAERQRRAIITTAVRVIQDHERARQGRLFHYDNYLEYELKQKIRLGYKIPKPDVELEAWAATTIQCQWNLFQTRQLLKRRELERRLLIGMIVPSWCSNEVIDTYNRNLEERRQFRDKRIQEYLVAHESEQLRVFRVIAPGLMEDIGDEIREWFHNWYVKAKAFDKYPDEEYGGTVLVVRAETQTPEEYLYEKMQKKKPKKKTKAEIAKEKKKKLDEKKKAKERLKKQKEAEKKIREKKWKKPLEYEMDLEPGTKMMNVFNEGMEEQEKFWDVRKDDPDERHYMDLITEEKCYQMQLEVRVKVDELMRLELELLQDALERDKRKGKKSKKKKKPKNKKKKKKGKGKKDMTGHRCVEDLFQELYDTGVIRKYETATLADYKGAFSYSNWEKRDLTFDPPATLGDVRQAIKLNCVLPMCVESIRKPRSVLVAGCRQSGKKLLANAVFTETQCVLFDLSPSNLTGKYPGKQGVKMLVHLVDKMARILQPSIIYFDAAEKVFYKKVPPEEKPQEPTRLSKQLMKQIVKKILPEDRVMVLGITGRPWLAKPKLKKTFERIILLPRTDYGSAYMYWRDLLMPYHGVDRNFDVSPLALTAPNMPLSAIREAVETVMSPRRIIGLKEQPLRQQELFEELLTKQPVDDKEWANFEKWYGKTALGKFRVNFNKHAVIQRAKDAKADKQKKK